jgi:hypothetical protein
MIESTFIKNGQGKEVEIYIGRKNKWDYLTKAITKDCDSCDSFIGMVEARLIIDSEKADIEIDEENNNYLGLCVRGNVRKILIEDEEERHRCPYNYF